MGDTVWDRLYEDGIDKMEARHLVEEQPFSFMPDIGDSRDLVGGDSEVFDRLYEEGLQRKEVQMRRLDEEQRRYDFCPNGARSYDEECWNRLYEDGMQSKVRLERRRLEPMNESLTFKPKVTPYFVKDPSISIFDRLYEEAKQKKEIEARRKSDSYAALKQMYGFRPAISSNIPGRGKDIYQELYQDAVEKRMKAEELAKRMAEEAQQKKPTTPAPFQVDVEPRNHTRKPVPEPTEDWPAVPFVPKINDVKGVQARYLQPRRKYEPLPFPSPALDHMGRRPWVSPLEANSMEAAALDRGLVPGRRSRSASTKYSSALLQQLEEQPLRPDGLRPVPSLVNDQKPRKTRAKSADHVRTVMSTGLQSPEGSPVPSQRLTPQPSPRRSPGRSPRSVSETRFRYVPRSPEGGRGIRSVQALDFNKGNAFRSDYFQSRNPDESYTQSSTGLRTLASYSTLESVSQPSDGGSPGVSGLIVRRDVTPTTSVSRTVDRQIRVIDLT